MYKGKRVELFYLSSAAPKHIDITSFAHHSVDLLEFLNVEVESFKLDDFVYDALMFIEDWNQSSEGKTNRWLGAAWLRERFRERFSIPSNVASDLIDHLQATECIVFAPRDTDSGVKSSIVVSDKGRRLISGLKEVAAR